MRSLAVEPPVYSMMLNVNRLTMGRCLRMTTGRGRGTNLTSKNYLMTTIYPLELDPKAKRPRILITYQQQIFTTKRGKNKTEEGVILAAAPFLFFICLLACLLKLRLSNLRHLCLYMCLFLWIRFYTVYARYPTRAYKWKDWPVYMSWLCAEYFVLNTPSFA